MKAMFLRHEGYLGAVGAFMKSLAPQDTNKAAVNPNMPLSDCWVESYITTACRQKSIAALQYIPISPFSDRSHSIATTQVSFFRS